MRALEQLELEVPPMGFLDSVKKTAKKATSTVKKAATKAKSVPGFAVYDVATLAKDPGAYVQNLQTDVARSAKIAQAVKSGDPNAITAEGLGLAKGLGVKLSKEQEAQITAGVKAGGALYNAHQKGQLTVEGAQQFAAAKVTGALGIGGASSTVAVAAGGAFARDPIGGVQASAGGMAGLTVSGAISIGGSNVNAVVRINRFFL